MASASSSWGCGQPFHLCDALLLTGGWHAGLFDVALNLLGAWAQQHAVSQTPAEADGASIKEVPRWVDALLLCLDMGMQPQPESQSQPEQPDTAAGAAPSSSTPAPSDTPAAGQAPPAAPPSTTPSSAPAAEAAAGGEQTAAAPSTTMEEEKKEDPPAVKTVEERQQAATQMLRDNIRTMFLPNGLLSQQQLERAATICMKLLQHLHAWGAVWKVPTEELAETEAFARLQPASSTQAVIQVLARVTKSHKVALKVCSPSCLRLRLWVLILPSSCTASAMSPLHRRTVTTFSSQAAQHCHFSLARYTGPENTAAPAVDEGALQLLAFTDKWLAGAGSAGSQADSGAARRLLPS